MPRYYCPLHCIGVDELEERCCPNAVVHLSKAEQDVFYGKSIPDKPWKYRMKVKL